MTKPANSLEYVRTMLYRIENASSLDEMTSIIGELGHCVVWAKIFQSVALYFIDRRRLYLQADCRSLTEYVRKHAKDLGIKPTTLSKYRKIGAGYVQNQVWLSSIRSDIFAGKLTKIALLTDALADSDPEDVKKVFLDGTTEDMEQLTRRSANNISGLSAAPPSVKADTFEREFLTPLLSLGREEDVDFARSIYSKDIGHDRYVKNKSATRQDKERLVDLMYATGMKGKRLHTLDHWLNCQSSALLNNQPLDQRTSRVVFRDDDLLPDAPIREAILSEVAKHCIVVMDSSGKEPKSKSPIL